MLAIFTLFWTIYILGMSLKYGYNEVSKYRKWKRDHFKVTVRENPNHGKVETVSPPPNVGRAAGFSPPSQSSEPLKVDPEQSVRKVTKVTNVPDWRGRGGMAIGGPIPYDIK